MLKKIKGSPALTFLYDGKPFAEAVQKQTTETAGDVTTTVFLLEGGLKVMNIQRFFADHDAVEIMNHFENTGAEPSGIVSELWDASLSLPLGKEIPYNWASSYRPDIETATKVYSPDGSTWDMFEFSCDIDFASQGWYPNHFYVGRKERFSNRGGRSSDLKAPFFNIHKEGHGYVYAVGWTGQWNCEIERGENDVSIRSKIEDTNFRVLPGEKFRTSSAVVMSYDGDFIEGQNKWRRLVKKHFSLIGKEGRDKYGPLCANIWGGMTTKSALDRVEIIRKEQLPFEYIWMDAGWYGADTKPTADEFIGDWWSHTGDWRVSSLIHPNGLKDVTKAVHDAGMRFVLWYEPERVRYNCPIAAEHPEYFLYAGNPDNQNLLLNLGNDDAWNYIFRTLSDSIRGIGVDCFRQDFNFEPLGYWRDNDSDDRKGVSEIKYINGLYKLWDSLLEEFPHLLIDNCASGGRRIDIETLRRSMPLWRSDLECGANYPIVGAQTHHLSFNLWMPYSGTGSGRVYDTYRMRSSYDNSLATNYTFSEKDNFGDDPEKTKWLRDRLSEYLMLRPYFSENFCPLTEVSDKADVWSAAQFHRPSAGDGIVQIFRREKSPYSECTFFLRWLDPEKTYVFRDIDEPEKTFEKTGRELQTDGLVLRANKREAKIFLYEAK